ncbi:MAG: 4-(cytidine 5'-diphospho)-2-C-methyl-D-erythritol kinase [Clostridia bacterium]|nr:4-(cytidine 5'-diphospho)-2-C-methyl-D-erythritol kinase [Clostridia bacterium]
MSIAIRAYAKINWSLSVTGVRADGYHELDMLMQSIDLCDELYCENARWLRLNVDGQNLPVGNQNLVVRAAQALNEYIGVRHGAVIRLRKRIPARAGLGGGSADCAAALVALNRLWNLRLPMEKLVEIGATLGADVPFCLTGGLARVRGIGEQVESLPEAGTIALCMCTPGGGLSTPQVFQTYDEMHLQPQPCNTLALAEALRTGALERAQHLSLNALEAPAIALMPQIGETMEALRAMQAEYVRMSGSGSTVFGAFQSAEASQTVAERLPGAYTARTVSQGWEWL